MKRVLTVLGIIIWFNGVGQIIDSTHTAHIKREFKYIPIYEISLDTDTIPMIILCCDTSFKYGFNLKGDIFYHVFWTFGYLVRTNAEEFELIIRPLVDKINLYYLNSDKKPFSKNIIVWQHKEISNQK